MFANLVVLRRPMDARTGSAPEQVSPFLYVLSRMFKGVISNATVQAYIVAKTPKSCRPQLRGCAGQKDPAGRHGGPALEALVTPCLQPLHATYMLPASDQ